MNKRTFVIIGTILLIAIIAIVGYSIARQNTRTKAQAEASTKPLNLRISEISQTSFTVEWETEADFSGYLYLGITPDNLKVLGQDEKGTYKFKEHTITVTKLQPNTTYYYIIISEDDTYTSGGEPFQITTLK